MPKTILITGATDGIGLHAAKRLSADGHHVLLHGRNAQKLSAVARELSQTGNVSTYVADLSSFTAVTNLAHAVVRDHQRLDVLMNNAGVLKADQPITQNGLDVRFMVNTIAPYGLTTSLLPVMDSDSRVVNVSSAAQAPVDVDALNGTCTGLDMMQAYAQSKLAIIMWGRVMSERTGSPAVISLNPGSLLASKMVKDGFGIAGKDIAIGANILVRAALSDEFATKNGAYFDNDAGRFIDPHSNALDKNVCQQISAYVDGLWEKYSST